MEFNDWLDSQNDPILIPVEQAKTIPFSIFLFTYDVDTYRAMLLQYNQSEEEDSKMDNDSQELEVSIAPTTVEEEPVHRSEPEPELQIDKVQDIAKSLFINDEVRQSITDKQSDEVAKFVRDYANNRAGIDWQNRASLIAKFRIQLKRQLVKETYSEAYIDDAIDLLINKAKQYYPSEN